MMTEEEANRAFASLDADDREVVMSGIVGSAGPEGIAEDEVVRQVGIVAKWVFEAAIQSVLLDKMRAGVVIVTANAEGHPQFAAAPRVAR